MLMITRLQSGIVKPIDRLSLHTSSISPIPKNPSHSLKDPNWHNAMYDEYNVLVKNCTWLLVSRPAGVNMVRSMWLFQHKFHADGTLSRYKAHLVANGSSQQLGIDLMRRLARSLNWPPFVRSLALSYLGSQVAYLLIYVDDIILTTSCPTLLQQIIGYLNNEFDMTDLGALNYFLVQQICLYMHDLREPYLAALKRILRYIQCTMDLGLHLYASPPPLCVAAEYRGVANIVAETAWLRKLLREPTDKATSSNPSPPIAKWLKIDSIVLSWIFMTLSKTFQQRLVIEDPQTTKEAWDLIALIFNDNKRTRSIA
ncbi:ribonuclease H-like domain-containing protein [Tanacetum coccineum]